MNSKSNVLLAFVLVAAVSLTVNAQWTRDSSSAVITPTTATDRVGVGSSGYPSAQLQVSGVYGTNIFRAYGNPGASPGSLWLFDSAPWLGFPGGILMKFEGNGQIQFPYMYIGNAGYPIIQSTAGTALLLNTDSGGGNVIVGNTATSAGLIVQSTGTSSFVGSVGIGTTTPGAKLQVVKSSTFSNASSAGLAVSDAVPYSVNLEMGADNTAGIGYIQAHALTSYSTKALVLQPNGGKVGIGTTNPGQALSVGGTIESTAGGFKFPDGSTQTTAAFQPSSGSLALTNSAAPAYRLQSTSGQQSVFSNGTGTFIDVFGAATASDNFLAFRVANTPNALSANIETMRITSTGVSVTGNATVSGTLTANAVVNAVYGQDVAEWVRADRELTAGTVVVVNSEKTDEVMPSSTAYDTTVAGVVSGQPGVILGRPGRLKATVATSGRVRVRVDARRGAIHTGDLLVTSDEPGTAMKSQPIELGGRKFHQPGTILGKALEPLPEGVGEILVLLCLG